MPRWLILVAFVISLFIVVCQKNTDNTPEIIPQPQKGYLGEIPENDWKVEYSISPENDSTVLLVTTKEKYDGFRDHYAMAVFSNSKTHQYRLIAPWYKGIELQWSLITERTVIEVPVDSIPKYRKDIWAVIEQRKMK